MGDDEASLAIDTLVAGIGDWRGPALARLRDLIRGASPEVVEEVKWRKPSNPAGVPTWSAHGLLCTGEVYRTHVKVTFAKGAALEDPDGLFNDSLDGNLRRAIDLSEGEHLDEAAFLRLVQASVAHNRDGARRS